eukprot:1160599-Pelagomonas_calceolata.AAC.12
MSSLDHTYQYRDRGRISQLLTTLTFFLLLLPYIELSGPHSPVQRQRQDLHGVDACVQISAMQRVDDGAHGGLACGPTHGVHAAVDNVRALQA